MLFLIYDGQLSGTTIATDSLPEGFEAVEGPDLPLERVYWDGSQVQAKPTQPSSLHYWDGVSHQWQLPEPVSLAIATPSSPEDWDGLTNALRNTAVFAKVYGAATQPEASTIAALTKTLKANTAYTLLMDTLSKTHHSGDLQFAIAQLREVMATIAAIGDFTPEELAWLNQHLKSNGFEIRLEAHEA
jgi:hypothetical protein